MSALRVAPLGRFRGLALLALLPLLASCTQLKRFAYEGFRRDGWQKPEVVIDSLEIEPGDRVADLGSGGGYFTFRLADAVGPSGRIYATDVDPGLNEYVAKRAREEGRENVEVILAEFDDPRLPEAEVDLLFTCNTYHHIEERARYFEQVRRYLRPGGRVAIIDYRERGWFMSSHGTPSETITSEMEQAGYRQEREFDFLAKQHFLVFSRADE